METDKNNSRPLLSRLNELENNLNLLAEQVLHPKSEDKLKLFERKLLSIDEMRDALAGYQKSEDLSRQDIIEKLVGVKRRLEGIDKNKEDIFENRKEVDSELVKISKIVREIESRLEEIDKLKKQVESDERDTSLDFSKISRKIADIEDVVLKDSKSVFESRKRLDEHFAKTFNRMAEVEEELAGFRVLGKRIQDNKIAAENRIVIVNSDLVKIISENKKITDKATKDISKRNVVVDYGLNQIPLIKAKIFENDKDDKIQKKSILSSILKAEKRQEDLENNYIVKNESISIDFGKVNSELGNILTKLSKNDLKLAAIPILEKSLKENRSAVEKEILNVRNEFHKKADAKHGIFSDKLRAIDNELMKVGSIRKAVAISEKNISLQNNTVLEKMRIVDKGSNEVRKLFSQEKVDVDFEFERVGKGMSEINRELKIFRDLGFAVNKIHQRKEIERIKKNMISNKTYSVTETDRLSKDIKSIDENLMIINQFRDVTLEDKKEKEKRLLNLDKHFGTLDRKIEKINLLEDVISKNKAATYVEIKTVVNGVRDLGLKDKDDLNTKIAGVSLTIEEFGDVVSKNKVELFGEVKKLELKAKEDLSLEISGVFSKVNELTDIVSENKSDVLSEIKIAASEVRKLGLGDKEILDSELAGVASRVDELVDTISKNKSDTLNDIKAATKEMEQFSIKDRTGLEIEMKKSHLKVNELAGLIFENKKIILDDFKISIKEIKQASLNDRKSLSAEIVTFSKKINMFSKDIDELPQIKQSIKDERREVDLSIRTVSDKLEMVEKTMIGSQKYNIAKGGKQKLYEESVLREILDGIKSNDKKIKDVEKGSIVDNDKVYVRLDEIVELVMFWEKRLNKLENYVNNMDYKKKKTLDEIESAAKKNSSKIEIAKVKKEILSQLKKSHGKIR